MSENRIVAVTSGKGGTGKSTFSVNLAIAAAEKDSSVLLIDMDAGMRCLDMLLGVSESVLMDVSDVLEGADIDRSVISIPQYPNIFLLPAPASAKGIDPDGFSKLIETLRNRYSLIVIDFPAGSDYTLYEKLPIGTKFICVCNPDPVSVRDAALCGVAIRSVNRDGFLIINKYKYKQIASDSFKTLDDIINETGLKLLGIVPLSNKFSNAFYNKKFPQRGREANAFRRIFARIDGDSVPLLSLNKI